MQFLVPSSERFDFPWLRLVSLQGNEEEAEAIKNHKVVISTVEPSHFSFKQGVAFMPELNTFRRQVNHHNVVGVDVLHGETANDVFVVVGFIVPLLGHHAHIHIINR